MSTKFEVPKFDDSDDDQDVTQTKRKEESQPKQANNGLVGEEANNLEAELAEEARKIRESLVDSDDEQVVEGAGEAEEDADDVHPQDHMDRMAALPMDDDVKEMLSSALNAESKEEVQESSTTASTATVISNASASSSDGTSTTNSAKPTSSTNSAPSSNKPSGGTAAAKPMKKRYDDQFPLCFYCETRHDFGMCPRPNPYKD